MFGKIDTVDALMGGLFTLASLTTTGVYTGGKLQPGNIGLGDAVWSSGGTSIAIAFLLALTAIGAAYATNRLDDSKSGRDIPVNTDLTEIAKGQASVETYVTGDTVPVVITGSGATLGGTVLKTHIVPELLCLCNNRV